MTRVLEVAMEVARGEKPSLSYLYVNSINYITKLAR